MTAIDERCPVMGCPNLRDYQNGHLCWRHRQMVKPALMSAIRKAENRLRSNQDEHAAPELRGIVWRAVTAAACAAKKTEEWVRSTRDGGSDAPR